VYPEFTEGVEMTRFTFAPLREIFASGFFSPGVLRLSSSTQMC
jgi:hypothetical protein